MNTSHFKNGDTIFEAKNEEEFQTYSIAKKPAWRYGLFDPSLKLDSNSDFTEEFYGKLYNWYAVIDNRGLAPNDWHIPTNSEWKELVNSLGDSAGAKMKDTIGYYPYSGTNKSGFNGLPAGGGGIMIVIHKTFGDLVEFIRTKFKF